MEVHPLADRSLLAYTGVEQSDIALRSEDGMACNVLVLTDQARLYQSLVDALGGEAPDLDLHHAHDRTQAIAAIEVRRPELAVVRYSGSPRWTVSTVSALRLRAPDFPILAEVPAEHPLVALQAFAAGANDCVKQPVAPWEWQHRCRALLNARRPRRLTARLARHLADVGGVDHMRMVLERVSGFRDAPTGAHGRRTGRLTRLAAEALRVPGEECRLMEAGAALHDIGKVGIPDRVLCKTGRFEAADREVMKAHPTIGHAILAAGRSESLQMGATIALGHHERFDGNGYPQGLAGDAIPLAARVTAVADALDFLTARRPYKPDCSVDEAFQILGQAKGTHFDPECVDALADRRPDVERLVAQWSAGQPG